MTFPLALGLTTMGIAGLLVATVPTLSAGMGGATAGAAPEVLSTVGNAIPAPAAASAAPAASGVRGQDSELYGVSAAPTSETSSGGEVFTGDDGDGLLDAQRQDADDMARDAALLDDSTGRSTLVVLAATLLIAGLGLFALRWTARRFGD